MDSKTRTVEMFFFPFVGGGHQIPMVDIARLFASHGAKSTIIVTPTNALNFQNSILRDQNSGRPISIHALQLPDADGAVSPESDMSATPFTDTAVLQEPLKLFLIEHKPDCIVFDMFHRGAAELFDELGIRRIIFNGSGCLPGCVAESLRKYEPHEKVGSDYEPFVVPGLPDRIELTRSQLPDFVKDKSGRLDKMAKDEEKSFGSVVNSFYDLEPAFADFSRKEMGKKAWLVGPASLCNTNITDKAERGKQADQSCLGWLDKKEPNSVLYISFGSKPSFAPGQFVEIAHALEASNHSFIWWMSIKSEKKALIVREKVEVAVKRLMGGGDEVVEMRKRARELAEKAKKAVQVGGSSYMDADALIEELKSLKEK
ncbi:abscisate beta-glucosyltransferase [Quercus suber]|uniref:Abscisate beta-glucosyltransferase n=1 Tax=Quercus suber TaxID=58331 RepID=A0AAW0KEU5_QUESU